MVVNISHGSSLYWSPTMMRTHLVMIKKYWCISDAWLMMISDKVNSCLKVITCSFKSLSYRIPLASWLGRILLYINLIIIMWWGPKHQYFPKSQVVKWKYWPRLQSCIWKHSTTSALKSRSVTFFSNAYSLLTVCGATTITSYSRCGSTLSPLCHSGVEAVPLVKIEKKRFPSF